MASPSSRTRFVRSPLLWCGFRGIARPPYHSQTNSCGKARSLRDRLWTCRGGRLPPAAWRTNLCPCVDIGSGPVGSSGAGRQGDRRFDSGTSVVRTPHPSREWVARALLEIDQHGPLTELAIAVGPRVRISFAPAKSQERTCRCAHFHGRRVTVCRSEEFALLPCDDDSATGNRMFESAMPTNSSWRGVLRPRPT